MLRWQHFYHVLYTKTDTLKVRTRTKVYQGDRTFLDETLTVTPVSAHRPKLTQALLQQRLYRTPGTPLKLTITRLLQPYDIRVAHKLIRRLHVLANVKDIKTDRRTDKEYYTKIKCCQTTYIGEAGGKFSLARDWLNTNERQEMVILILNHNAEHHLQKKTSNRHVLSILQAIATINGSL